MRHSSRQEPIGEEEAESFDTGVSISQIEAVNRAEIDIQIATAKRFPRSMAAFRKRVYELATLDEETAASCFYSVPRGGRQIEGPSARMAEIVACSYGNLRVASRVVEDQRQGIVTVEAVAIDLEANYAVKAEVVQRVVGRQDDDMRNLAVMSAQSKARRNAVFGIVPGSEIKAIMAKVREVAVGKAETIGSTRATVLDLLAKMGATRNRVLARLGVGDVAEISLDHILLLRSLGADIRDGRTTVDDAFPIGVVTASGVKAAPASEPPAVTADGKPRSRKLREVEAKIAPPPPKESDAPAPEPDSAPEPEPEAAPVEEQPPATGLSDATLERLEKQYAAGAMACRSIKKANETAEDAWVRVMKEQHATDVRAFMRDARGDTTTPLNEVEAEVFLSTMQKAVAALRAKTK